MFVVLVDWPSSALWAAIPRSMDWQFQIPRFPFLWPPFGLPSWKICMSFYFVLQKREDWGPSWGGGWGLKFFLWDNFPPAQRAERTLSRKLLEGIIHSEFAFLPIFVFSFQKNFVVFNFHNRSSWVFVLEMAAEFFCDKGKLLTPAALWPGGEEGPAAWVWLCPALTWFNLINSWGIWCKTQGPTCCVTRTSYDR